MVDAERQYVLFPKEIGLDEDGDNSDAGVASGVESNEPSQELSPGEDENGTNVQCYTEKGCRISGLGTLFFLLATLGRGRVERNQNQNGILHNHPNAILSLRNRLPQKEGRE